MGYNVWCWDDLEISWDKASMALAALHQLAKERDANYEGNLIGKDGKVDYSDPDWKKKYASFENLVFNLSSELFNGETIETEGKISYLITHPEDSIRNEDEAKEMFEVLAPFLEGQTLSFEGEDRARWSWSFKNGEIEDDWSTEAWSKDRIKIDAFDAILKIIYLDGKFVDLSFEDQRKIIQIIKETGLTQP